MADQITQEVLIPNFKKSHYSYGTLAVFNELSELVELNYPELHSVIDSDSKTIKTGGSLFEQVLDFRDKYYALLYKLISVMVILTVIIYYMIPVWKKREIIFTKEYGLLMLYNVRNTLEDFFLKYKKSPGNISKVDFCVRVGIFTFANIMAYGMTKNGAGLFLANVIFLPLWTFLILLVLAIKHKFKSFSFVAFDYKLFSKLSSNGRNNSSSRYTSFSSGASSSDSSSSSYSSSSSNSNGQVVAHPVHGKMLTYRSMD